MQLAAAARQDGFTLPVADVFQYATLSRQAKCLQSETDNASADLVPLSLISKVGIRDDLIRLAVLQCQVPEEQIADIYPCTALQEGLMVLTIKTAGAYVAHFSYTVPNEVNLDKLHAAWNAVARANPILNTRIIKSLALGTFQVVVPADLEWVINDNKHALRSLTSTSFRFGEPLVRVAVVRSHDRRTPHWLMLSMHHAVYDAWSLPLLLEQVEATLRGEPLRPRPFSPFVAYLIQSKEAAEAFWRTELTDSNAVPFPPLPAPSYTPTPTESATHTIPLSPVLPGDFTLSTTLRLAWALSLSQYTNTDDVVFGLTVTGRGAPVVGIEQMTGPTIATIPLRVRLDGDATAAQALRQVQNHSARLLPYEQTGLQNIRRLSDEAAAACDFQNLLVIQPRRKMKTGDLFTEADVTAREGAFTTYALTLVCELSSDSVVVQATYDPHVIGGTEVQRLLYQLAHVTQAIHCHPDRRIRDMSSLSPEDRAQLQRWNGVVPARVERCVHELIAERCQTQPDAPAVCAWDGDFTYGELDRRSSALAAHLARLGVGPEVFVPLLFEKSRWTAVAMLGVMKAGGAFVLLDPSHPRARLQDICQIVSAGVVVASASQAPTAEQWAGRVVTVGTDEIVWRSSRRSFKRSSVAPGNALYAVFTSGSTGSPKGAVITHSAYCTSAISHSRAYGLSADSRVFQFSSYAFDASILEQLTTLFVGGCVCIPSDADRQNHMGVTARQLRVTWAELTPSAARMFHSTEVEALSTLVLMGESVTSSDIKGLVGLVDLMVGYGPAECSITSTVQSRIKKASDGRSIGQPTGSICWVVNPGDDERLLPIGAVGELLIEGPIVGRGYLNDPEKTAAAFIDPPAWLREFRAAHPGNRGGDRVYKTGDLVQYAADGSLRFVGRKDTQVKLRGQRIELGEVEHHTRACFPKARDVVAEVVTPAKEGGAPMLMAFVWADRTDRADHDATEEVLLRPTDAFRAAIPAAEARLHDAVPAYMVPAVFLPVAAVPLTATGKTDRRRLRDRAAALSRAEIESYSVAAGAKRAPASAAERTLQRLWARVLNLSPAHIGADDSFFRLGGDSITAMQLSSLARTEGFTLSVSDIFHSKTVAALAPFVGVNSQTALDVEESVDVPFELSPIQRLFFDLALNGANYFNQSFLIPLAGSVASRDLARAIPLIIERHSMLRARFSQHSDASWYQAVCTDVESSYRYHRSAVRSLEEARSVMHASQRSLDFRNGPLFSVDLIDVSPGQEQYVFLVAHHLVIDLVSWRVILGDLEDLLQNGQISAPKPLPFQAWCQLQVEYAHDHLDPARALPFTLPDAAPGYWGPLGHLNTWDNAIHGSFTLSQEVTASLFGKANDTFQTQPVEIFVAALWHAFVRTFPDHPPPTIFSEGHGREPWDTAIDLSRTVGWFTTMWPMCIETDGDEHDIVDVVRRSKDMRRRTPSNGWAYFASRFLNPDGQKAFETHGPVEIAFNYLGLYQQFEREGALFRPPITLEDQVPDVAGHVPRFALIDISGGVERDRLRFSFSYSRHMQHQHGIVQWIANCEQSLQEAAKRLVNMDRSFTLCDFPLLPLTYKTLDRLMGKIMSQMPPLEVEDAYPSSPMQRGILISQRKDARLYQTTSIWRVAPKQGSSPVDLGRLQRAWQQVTDRHAILRTIFVESVSQSAYIDQVVRTSAPVDVDIVRHSSDDDPVTMTKVHLEAGGREERALHLDTCFATGPTAGVRR
ncbi:hypothetical protein CNMCM8980_007023 [Aspergillus fumigatiaffinis]|nr:hypothetical protein CNMCM8980_007023 [Aspergillus fumigatiaffinis]